MEDPNLAWPAWKFGMKRDALFTTLHDQYNTIQSTIQDPEAFHHDVNDVAVTASTTAEFHRLLSVRREQRIRELNESLESAAFEIIANPSLVGSSQWAYALQLFRSRSLDSLVRFFSSYIPADHPWRSHVGDNGNVAAEHAESDASPAAMPAAKENGAVSDAEAPLFHDTLTPEPQDICDSPSLFHENQKRHHELPPSPRPLASFSDKSHIHTCCQHHTGVLTPARTLTSDSVSDRSITVGPDHQQLHDALRDSVGCFDEAFSPSSSSSGPDTPKSMSEFGDSLHVVDFSDHASTDEHASHDADATTNAPVSCSPLVGGLVDASTDCKPLASLSHCSSDDSTQLALALRACNGNLAQTGRAGDCSGGRGRTLRSRGVAKMSRSCSSWPQRRSPRQHQKDVCQHIIHQKHDVCRHDAGRVLRPLAQRRGARRAAIAAWCRRTVGPNTTSR